MFVFNVMVSKIIDLNQTTMFIGDALMLGDHNVIPLISAVFVV